MSKRTKNASNSTSFSYLEHHYLQTLANGIERVNDRVEKLSDRMDSLEKRFTEFKIENRADRESMEKRLAADREYTLKILENERKAAEARQQATEKRLESERKASEKRLEDERKASEKRLEDERRDFRQENRATRGLIIGAIVTMLLGFAGIIFI